MRKILLVIDMQNDFIDCALGTAEAQAIVPAVCAKIRQYDPADVYATRDTHFENYMESLEGHYLPVPHCIEGTDGWQLRPEIAALIREDHIIDKYTFGSEVLTELAFQMSTRDELEIELVGLCTDICVISNALLLRAKMPGTVIRVDAACCAGVTPQKHDAALVVMRSCQIEVI